MSLTQRRPLRRTLSTVLLLAYLSGCTEWRVAGPTPAEFIAREAPENVRLTRTDSSQIVVEAPRVRSDTLFGILLGGAGKGDTVQRYAVALADIRTVEVRKVSTKRTLGLAAGVLGGFLVIALLSCAGSSNNYGC